MEDYPSGERGQTVNLLATAYCGSNPQSTTKTTSFQMPSFFIDTERRDRFHRYVLSCLSRQDREQHTPNGDNGGG